MRGSESLNSLNARSVPHAAMTASSALKAGVSWLANISLPGALGVQRTSVKQSPRGSLGIRSRQNFQLLLCPVIFAGKQQKLEQERTALGVERIGSQLFAKRRDGLPQSSLRGKAQVASLFLR